MARDVGAWSDHDEGPSPRRSPPQSPEVSPRRRFRSGRSHAHTSGMEELDPVDVVVVGDDGARRDVTVRLHDDRATVDHLAAALGGGGAVYVDGVEVLATTPLVTAGLRRGSTVARRPPAWPR